LIRFLERAMPKPHSVDLRARVIEDVETGASRREAAERYGISPSVVVIWVSAAGSDPAGVRLPLLEARAFLGLMAPYEAAGRCSNCSVMAGIVASDTPDNGALQASLGRGRRYQHGQK
jgi:Homeodomain-like domain